MQYYCHNCQKVFQDCFPIIVEAGDLVRCPECLKLSKVDVIEGGDSQLKEDKEREI